MAKEYSYRGKSLDELQKMDIKEFGELLPARQRRSLKRGLSEEHKRLREKIKNSKGKVRTHMRNMIIFPDMVGKVVYIHNGKTFLPVSILENMIGHYLGEFSLTRGKVAHSAPGIGATRSSAAVSVK
jgi:small subunit ribosomal protein S19